jgi:hypothetical protein
MKSKYYEHRQNARRRKIEFILTYDEWMNIWLQSGHWENRGRGADKYAMCRYNDIGPYSVNNVYIDLNRTNSGLARIGDKNSIEHTNKIIKALKGKQKTIAHKIKNSIGQLKRPKYNCPHCNKIISGMGNVKQHVAHKHGIIA